MRAYNLDDSLPGHFTVRCPPSCFTSGAITVENAERHRDCTWLSRSRREASVLSCLRGFMVKVYQDYHLALAVGSLGFRLSRLAPTSRGLGKENRSRDWQIPLGHILPANR